MNIVKQRFILALFIVAGFSQASLDLRKQAHQEVQARKLYMQNPSPLNMYGSSLYNQQANISPSFVQSTRRVASRRAQDEPLDAFDAVQKDALEQTQSAINSEADLSPSLSCSLSSADMNILCENGAERIQGMFEPSEVAPAHRNVSIYYNVGTSVYVCEFSTDKLQIPGNLPGYTDSYPAQVTIQINSDGEFLKKIFDVVNGQLGEPADGPQLQCFPSPTVLPNSDIDPISEPGNSIITTTTEEETTEAVEISSTTTRKLTLIHRERNLLVADEIEVTGDHLTAEPEGEHLENEVIVGDAIVHNDNGDSVEQVVLDHGVLKEVTENNVEVSTPDLSHADSIHATILEEDASGDHVFEAEIHNGQIIANADVPSEVLNGHENLTVITHEGGVPVLQHVEENNGVIVDHENTDDSANYTPVAQVLGSSILAADAIIDTTDGPIVEPVVFNNGVLVQEPSDVHLDQGVQQIDAIVHGVDGPHVEHIQLVNGEVTQAIADQTSIAGTAEEGEQHVDVIVRDHEGYHVEDILVKGDQIVEEPSDMDLEHGHHEIDTVIHDNNGPHIEHWQIEEGTVITHHVEGYIESHGNTQSAEMVHSQESVSSSQIESGTVHVEMVLNYGKSSTVENVVLHNGMIIEESPGIDLQHGVHIADAITKNVFGTKIEPVVIHDGLVEPTAHSPIAEPHVDVSHGDVHAQVIEGEGSNAKIEDVTIHDGHIVEESGDNDLSHGVHEVLTINKDTAEPQIEENVVVDGEVKVLDHNDDTQHALIVLKEGEQTGVSEVQIHDHKIIEQSEGTDLTSGVFVGTEIDLSNNGGIVGTKEVVGNEGVISEVTSHMPVVDQSHSENGAALIVVESANGTQVDQITHEGPHITSSTGPIDLSQPTSGVEVVLNPDTHAVEAAHQVEINNNMITSIDQEPVESVHEVQETPVVEAEIPITDAQVHTENQPSEEHVQVEESSIPASRRAFVIPKITPIRRTYATPYNPLIKRGLKNISRPTFNQKFNNQRPISRVAYNRPVTRQANNRIAYNAIPVQRAQYQPRIQKSVIRPVQPQARIQKTVYQPAHPYNPTNSLVANIRTTRGRGANMVMIKQPAIPLRANAYNRRVQDQAVEQVQAQDHTAVEAHQEVTLASQVTVHQLTFDDIPVMTNSIESVQKKYAQYYSAFPFAEGESKLLVNSHEDVINYYERMRKFVRTVMEDRSDLVTQFFIIRHNNDLLVAGEKEMIAFYGYHNTYENINEQLKGFQQNPKVDEYQKDIDRVANEFATEVKQAHEASAKLVQQEAYFESEISQINQITAENESLVSMEKYDRMLALGVKLIQIRSELEANISDLKAALARISLLKAELDKNIAGLKFMLSDGRLVKVGSVDEKAGASISKIIVTLGVLLMLL